MNHTAALCVIVSVVLSGALLLTRLAGRFRVPDILWFMLLGLMLGPFGLNLASGESLMGQDHVFLLGAVFLVLYEAGTGTRLSLLRRHAVSVGLLVTAGLLLTTAMLAASAHLFLGYTLSQGLLLGAILSTTDPASILPILRRLSIPPRVVETLVAESAIGDVTGSLLSLFLLSWLAAPPSGGILRMGMVFFWSVVGATVVGLSLGWIFVLLTRHSRFGIFRRSVPVFLVAVLLGGFGISLLFHLQTLLLGYLLGVAAGQTRREEPAAGVMEPALSGGNRPGDFETMNDLLVYLATFFIFLVMGTLIPHAGSGFSLGGTLLFLASLLLVVRPVVVFSLVPFDNLSHFTSREMGFMATVRETGIMAGALLGLVHGELPSSASAVVFAVVVGTIAVGALVAAPAARILGLETGMGQKKGGSPS
ncbi:MAG: cation:proton antiporter [Leptospirillia bacterium]